MKRELTFGDIMCVGLSLISDIPIAHSPRMRTLVQNPRRKKNGVK